MLKCKDVVDRTSYYTDPSLPFHKKIGWRMHLLMCSSCRRFTRQFKLTIETARAVLSGKKASDEDVEAVMKKIQDAHNTK